tara:strand:- start:246 stop:668 length:423 start_codon:yes stop_codon:yes gene_type:complete
VNLSLDSDALLGLYFSPLTVLNAVGSLLKWLFLKKPDQSKQPTLKERTQQTVRADQVAEIHIGPKGGLYRIDANGKKVYLKASEQPKQGKPRRAKRRRPKAASTLLPPAPAVQLLFTPVVEMSLGSCVVVAIDTAAVQLG